MKCSAALKLKVGDDVAMNLQKDGILWTITDIQFPMFVLQEKGTNYTKKGVHFSCFQKPTKVQLNAYNKRRTKYYENSDSPA